MGIEVLDLSELDTNSVLQQIEFMAELLQEDNPSIDTKRGVLHDLLIRYSGILAAANQENIDRIRRSSSLQAISEDPTLADDDIVDLVLSNYGLTRQEGTEATGTVTIVVDTLAPVVLPAGLTFDASGKTFHTEIAYTAQTTNDSVLSEADRVLTQLSDGNYSFTVDVVADAVGLSGEITKGTLMIPTAGITNYVTSYATSDFGGAVDTETNEQFLLRLQTGIAAEAASNRVNMYAMLRAQPGFENYVSASIIGFGDPEMLRDRHSIFPVSYGGRADWYVRTSERVKLVGTTLAATLIEKTGDGKGNWQISIGRDDYPGFYDVVSITPTDATNFVGTYDINQDIRSADVTSTLGELTPDIAVAKEAVYSRFQSAVIQFKDHDTDTSALTVNTSTKNYSVTFRMLLGIEDIQTIVGSRGHRNYAGDILVKAPIPCFVSMAFTIEGPPGATTPDPSVIADDIAGYVNNLGFTGRLSASAISDIIHNRIGSLTCSAVDMYGQILRPDGTIKSLRSSEVLIVPDEPENMISARTVVFFSDPEDIQISAAAVAIPEI